jgi:hypothetical protein
MLICLFHWLKTRRGLDDPGYRLWIHSGLFALANLPIVFFGPIVFGWDPPTMDPNGVPVPIPPMPGLSPFVYVPFIVLVYVGTIGMLLNGFSRERRWWRWTYLYLVALCLIQSAGWLSSFFDTDIFLMYEYYTRVPSLCGAIALLIFSVICDYRAGLKRDWIHCAGVLVFLLFNVGPVLSFFVYRFLNDLFWESVF